MNNNTSLPVSFLWAAADGLDRASVWFCLIAGLPGNMLFFLIMLSMPQSVCTFHFALLAVTDLISLILQLSMRCFFWYDLVSVTSMDVPLLWKIYFNVTYYTAIYSSWVMVFISVERLISLRYPSQASIYLTLPRAKMNAVLIAVLLYCFAAIVTIKMDYFGIAWVVVFTTLYTGFPVLFIIIIVLMILKTMRQIHQSKMELKKLEEENKLHGNKSSRSMCKSHSLPKSIAVPENNIHSGSTQSLPRSFKKHAAYTGVGIPRLDGISYSALPSKQETASATFSDNFPKSGGFGDPAKKAESLRSAKDKTQLEICYTLMFMSCALIFVALTIPYTVIEFIYVKSEKEVFDVFNEKQAEAYLLIIIVVSLMYIQHSINFYIFMMFSSRFRRQFYYVIKNCTIRYKREEDFEIAERKKAVV